MANSRMELLHAENIVIQKEQKHGVVWQPSTDTFNGLFKCENCKYTHMLTIKKSMRRDKQYVGSFFASFDWHSLNRLKKVDLDPKSNRNNSYHLSNILSDPNDWGLKLNDFFEIVDVYPSNEGVPIEHLPEDVHELYYSALEARPLLVASNCRILLEAVCKDKLGETPKNSTLASMIDAIAAREFIPMSMKEWAHELRLMGNKAVHQPDMNTTPEEAKAVLSLMKVLLEVLYSFPAKVENLRKSPCKT